MKLSALSKKVVFPSFVGFVQIVYSLPDFRVEIEHDARRIGGVAVGICGVANRVGYGGIIGRISLASQQSTFVVVCLDVCIAVAFALVQTFLRPAVVQLIGAHAAGIQ